MLTSAADGEWPPTLDLAAGRPRRRGASAADGRASSSCRRRGHVDREPVAPAWTIEREHVTRTTRIEPRPTAGTRRCPTAAARSARAGCWSRSATTTRRRCRAEQQSVGEVEHDGLVARAEARLQVRGGRDALARRGRRARAARRRSRSGSGAGASASSATSADASVGEAVPCGHACPPRSPAPTPRSRRSSTPTTPSTRTRDRARTSGASPTAGSTACWPAARPASSWPSRRPSAWPSPRPPSRPAPGAWPSAVQVGSSATRQSVRLARHAAAAGADAIAAVTPYYLKTDEAGLADHLRAIHEAAPGAAAAGVLHPAPDGLRLRRRDARRARRRGRRARRQGVVRRDRPAAAPARGLRRRLRRSSSARRRCWRAPCCTASRAASRASRPWPRTRCAEVQRLAVARRRRRGRRARRSACARPPSRPCSACRRPASRPAPPCASARRRRCARRAASSPPQTSSGRPRCSPPRGSRRPSPRPERPTRSHSARAISRPPLQGCQPLAET